MRPGPYPFLTLACVLLLAGCLATPGPGSSIAPVASERTASWSRVGADQAQEPTLGVTPDGAVLVLAGNDVYKGDGKAWTLVHSFEKAAGLPSTSDPWMFVDPADGNAYVDQMFPILVCTMLSTSTDSGTTWSNEAPVCPSPVIDFQKIVTGPPGPEPNPLAGSAFPRIVYACYNKPVYDFATGAAPASHFGLACAASYDGGKTWMHESLLGGATYGPTGPIGPASCGGGSWIPAVATDGTVVVRSQPDCLFRSRDSGATWTQIGTGPTDFTGTQLGFDAAGTLFAISSYWEPPLRFAVSHDQGDTWEPSRVIDLGHRSFGLEALATGPQGHLTVAFLGADGDFAAAEAPEGTTWSPWMVEVTGADGAAPQAELVHVAPETLDLGCLTRSSDCIFLGDFMRAVYAPDGSVWAVYPDACAAGTCGDATDAFVARLPAKA